jgi:hypothetical protein
MPGWSNLVVSIEWTVARAPGTMAEPMHTLRLALVLALVALLDLGGSTLPGGAETHEELEEAAHGRRRLVRLARQPAPPSADTDAARAAATRPRPVHHQPCARTAADPPRNALEPAPDPASPTDDH